MVLFVSSCSHKDMHVINNDDLSKIEKCKLTIENAWGSDKISPLTTSPETVGMYDDMIYYTVRDSETITLKFSDLNGVVKKSLTFYRGKGPGEILTFTNLLVRDGIIYFYDAEQYRLSMFDMQGDYLDCVLINESFGMGSIIDIHDNMVYSHGMFNTKAVKYDIENEKMIKAIKYYKDKNVLGITKELIKMPVKKGTIAVDDGKVHIGYWSKPFRIDVMDNDLEQLSSVTRKMDGKYKKYTFSLKGLDGNIMISSLKFDDEYMYACFGGGQTISLAKRKLTGIPAPFTISVFDKQTYRLEKELYFEEIPVLNGMAGIVGITDKYVVLLITDFGGSFDNLKQYMTDEVTDKYILRGKDLGINGSMIFVVKKDF